ncbi:hypothetical protein K2Z83_27060 [Oscillochloris sp. ZM17-4]|uniref:hypothetical protein n=1 Tax=Oscillochloris sp. ZM17-4 TaxID=2866714 RepID=UPI001C7305CD|nr:hypothetical protein [Oscillochloris sp. ZM17-4]MBX0331315.1 hypothetical protein [Oscillochloris sp. ZM17-4]
MMTTDRSDSGMGSDLADLPAQDQRAGEIDVKLLAEKVYRLLLADLRLAQARGERPARGRGRP